jgi:hypothetical protein
MVKLQVEALVESAVQVGAMRGVERALRDHEDDTIGDVVGGLGDAAALVVHMDSLGGGHRNGTIFAISSQHRSYSSAASLAVTVRLAVILTMKLI